MDLSDDDLDSGEEIDITIGSMLEEDDENTAFFLELEKEYEEEKKFGPEIDGTMAKLADTAIEKPMKEADYQKLVEKYLIPENCQKIQVLTCTMYDTVYM